MHAEFHKDRFRHSKVDRAEFSDTAYVHFYFLFFFSMYKVG
jgi:hypothetical protein